MPTFTPPCSTCDLLQKTSGASLPAPCNSAFVCPLRRRCHETFAAEHGQNPGSPDPGAHHDSPAQNCEMLSLLCPQFSRLSPHDLSPPAPTFPAPPRSPSPGLVPLPLPTVSRARQSHPSPAPAHCPPLIAGLSPPRARAAPRPHSF